MGVWVLTDMGHGLQWVHGFKTPAWVCQFRITLVKEPTNVVAVMPFAPASYAFKDMTTMAFSVLNLWGHFKKYVDW